MQPQDQINFDARLNQGEDGERIITRWLISKGRGVVPIYEKTENCGKGPRYFATDKSLTAPDLLVFNGPSFTWVEAKLKTVFSWHRITGKWETGIDRHHWRHYVQIKRAHPAPFWIMFLHMESRTIEHDGHSPVGLFGNEIDILARTISHEHDAWGRHGMVYWARDSLRLLASLDQLKNLPPILG